MVKFTWVGDSDPEAQSVTLFGHTFVKGEAVDVKDRAAAGKLATNPMFTTDAKPEIAKADEPSEEALAEAAEAGTEKAALKAKLREVGADVPKGNPGLDTLRAAYAKAVAG